MCESVCARMRKVGAKRRGCVSDRNEVLPRGGDVRVGVGIWMVGCNLAVQPAEVVGTKDANMNESSSVWRE